MTQVRRLTYYVVLVLALLVFVAAPSSAQQQTGQVAPNTRNPQTNGGLPSQQAGTVQTTETQQVLNRNQAITIPAGEPAADPAAAARQQGQKSKLLWVLSSASLVIAAICFVVLRRSKSVIVEEPVVPAKPVRAQPPRKSTPKKNSKAKPKTHKKRKRKV